MWHEAATLNTFCYFSWLIYADWPLLTMVSSIRVYICLGSVDVMESSKLVNFGLTIASHQWIQLGIPACITPLQWVSQCISGSELLSNVISSVQQCIFASRQQMLHPLSLDSLCLQVMFILFVVLGIVWVLLIVRASHNVHRIHHLMTALVVFKALTLLSQVTTRIFLPGLCYQVLVVESIAPFCQLGTAASTSRQIRSVRQLEHSIMPRRLSN